MAEKLWMKINGYLKIKIVIVRLHYRYCSRIFFYSSKILIHKCARSFSVSYWNAEQTNIFHEWERIRNSRVISHCTKIRYEEMAIYVLFRTGQPGAGRITQIHSFRFFNTVRVAVRLWAVSAKLIAIMEKINRETICHKVTPNANLITSFAYFCFSICLAQGRGSGNNHTTFPIGYLLIAQCNALFIQLLSSRKLKWSCWSQHHETALVDFGPSSSLFLFLNRNSCWPDARQ